MAALIGLVVYLEIGTAFRVYSRLSARFLEPPLWSWMLLWPIIAPMAWMTYRIYPNRRTSRLK